MTIKAKLDSGQNGTLLMIGDSLTGEQTFQYPYRVAQLLGSRYPAATVTFKSRQNGNPVVTVDTVLQTGSSSQQIIVIRDGIAGSTSFRADQAATIYSVPVDFASIFLGVNDAVNWPVSSQYTPPNYIDNLGYLVRYAQQNVLAEALLITPAWSEDSLTKTPYIAWAAAFSRYVARKNNSLLVDMRRIFEDHYIGTGLFGQGEWFADPTDHTHFGREGHYAIADEFMRVVFA